MRSGERGGCAATVKCSQMHIANNHFICFEVRNSLLNLSKEGGERERERERERETEWREALKGSTLILITGVGVRKVSALKVPGRARSSFW